MKVKNIIITGGSRGIGRALVEKCLNEGHNVFVISRSEDLLKKIADISNDEQFRYAPLDLATIEDYRDIHDYIYDWETVDVLYNNAGLLIKKPFQELTASDFLASYKVNFLAPTMLIQSLYSKFTKDSHIVNITTMGAVQGSVKFPELSAYGSSKATLVTLSEVLAQEFGEEGPSINCVALGAVQTEMLETAFPGIQAPVQPHEMAEYLYDFGLKAHQFMNGKIVQCSSTTP